MKVLNFSCNGKCYFVLASTFLLIFQMHSRCGLLEKIDLIGPDKARSLSVQRTEPKGKGSSHIKKVCRVHS